MEGLIAGITATIVTMPIIGLIIIYIICKSVISNKKKSFLLTVDLSTILFIISVHFLILVIVGNSYLWLLIIILLLTAMIFVFIHWKVKQEIDTTKVFKGFWRFTFLLFVVSYFVLMVVGLIRRVYETTIH